MVYSLLITLREGLEAALIIGILLACLTRAGQREGARPVLYGTVAALVVSLGGGLLFYFLAGGLKGAAMEIFEGSMMLLATGILTHMLIWMQREARHMKARIEGQVAAALTRGSTLSMALLSFTVVVREGLETALFLLAGARTADSLPLYLGGALAGVLAATALGVLLYRGSLRLNLRWFFGVTGWLLVLAAAGMLANGIKELHEAGVVPQVLAHVWDTYHLLPDTTAVGRLLGALAGYDPTPSLVQVVGYFGYLLLAGSLLVRSTMQRGVTR